jgi:hypothetical protein
MKTLNILTDAELKQIFGPLEDILPLHEGKLFFKESTKISILFNRSSLSFKTKK